MRKVFKLAVMVLILAGAVHGQTVTPVISECGKKCTGEFSISNNGLVPLAVSVEAHSFSMDTAGHPVYRALDSTVDLQLDEGSARIGPKASHAFGYRLKCSAVPCSVTFVSTMTVGHTADGILVRVQIPHVVYLCDKSKGCRDSVRRAAGVK
jgi:hypothetical protein